MSWIMLLSLRYWLSLLGTREETPNDPKLSDGGAWRGSCEGGAKKEAYELRRRWLGRRRVRARSSSYRDTRSRSLQRMVSLPLCGFESLRGKWHALDVQTQRGRLFGGWRDLFDMGVLP